MLEQKGKIDLFFGDESGVSLTPEIPYGWQEINQPIRMKTEKSKRLNIFGLMTRNNDLEAYMYRGSATGDLIIAFINDFAQKVVTKTTIVLDNATVHHSKKFQNKLADWTALGLDIFYLPTYSPHLNKIETLWRKIKYEWLLPKDYENLTTLEAAIDNIILKFGTKFTINFTD
jgi:transposase